MALEHCREAAALRRERDRLREELAGVQSRLDAALNAAIEELDEAGIPRLPINGYIICTAIRASVRALMGRDGEPLPARGKLPKEHADALRRALARQGLGDLMPRTLNTRGLNAWVVEQIEEGRSVPEALRHWLRVDTVRVPHIMADSGHNGRRSQAQSLDEALGERVD